MLIGMADAGGEEGGIDADEIARRFCTAGIAR
jgi:hypothetical protein